MIITVFDFDDTLFPTTHFELQPQGVSDRIGSIGLSISLLLENAMRFGKVYIITNAQMEWINGCLRWLPGCSDLGERIRIVSTRDEGYAVGDFATWKTNAFHSILREDFANDETHSLLAFGDMMFDRQAAMSIKEWYPNVVVKSLLMSFRPSISGLLRQHSIILYNMTYLFTSPESLDAVTCQTTSVPSIIQNSPSSSSDCSGLLRSSEVGFVLGL